MTDNATPLLKQYLTIKKQHPDKILFFRMGDFYEMFGSDAEIAAPILGIALTSRSHGKSTRMSLAGVPYHSADKYLAQLLKAGLKVAVCEQVEDPKLAKGLVRREVTEIITPGTITVDSALSQEQENTLACLRTGTDGLTGLAAVEFSTGRVTVFEGTTDEALEKLESLSPQELLLPEGTDSPHSGTIQRLGAQVSTVESWRFDYDSAVAKIKDYYRVESLEGFELTERLLTISALGALLSYLEQIKFGAPLHLSAPRFVSDPDRVYLDASTIRNLELLRSTAELREHSLLGLLDFCRTAMGKRCLARWLSSPLRNVDLIERRHTAVERLLLSQSLLDRLSELLNNLVDFERVAGKLGYRKANPRDLAQLRLGLERLPDLRAVLSQIGSELLEMTASDLPDLTELAQEIARALVDEPPLLTNGGGLIRSGYSEGLDELKRSIKDAVDYISNLQQRLRVETEIPSLKVGYNQVFGYYIEVTKPHLDKVPSHFVRKQTLVNAERFITEEMKAKESLILAAEEKINKLEETLFLNLRDRAAKSVHQINLCGRLLAEIDVLHSFAIAARRYRCVKPVMTTQPILNIKEGRHPVIEQLLPRGDFVSNDTTLDTQSEQIQLLTGPNMAGKSTYLRQVGLIVIMAQAGSFVPAEAATIGVVDRVFTRVGASDRLTMGESTFLVEMNETARILHSATPHSLILLDEVGRGTSTYDGLAIAWSLCEMLHSNPSLRARTVFATHFHELTEMATLLPRIRNYQVQVRRYKDRIVFLRKVKPGGCDDSFGIEVARLAGVPDSLTERAAQILRELETGNFEPLKRRSRYHYINPSQLGLFAGEEPEALKKLRALVIDQLSPIEALTKLAELQKLTEEGNDLAN